jgi:hypothetical protein
VPPPSRKFAVGDRVELSPGRSDPHIVAGAYTIVGLMPWQGGGYQYRVKHSRDQHQRVVSEEQLRRG